MVTFTTTDFIEKVKLVSHVPQGNNTFNEADFLSLADLEMRTRVAPKIASCRENYWLTTDTLPIDPGNKYAIPSKALGSAIVDVKVNSNTNLIHLARVEVSDLYSTQYANWPAYCFYIEDATIKLIPATLNGNVMIWYYRIPSELVPVVQCGQITEIDYVTGDVTVNALPSAFVGGGELDIVSQNPGFNVLLKDSTPLGIVSNVITFLEVPPQVKIGDYVCLSGQSCVIQCPLEWVEVLIQCVAVKIYEIQGYEKKQAMAEKTLERMEMAALGLVSPRTIENAKIISGGGSLLMPMNKGWTLPVSRNV